MGERPRDPGIIYLSKKVAEFSTLRLFSKKWVKPAIEIYFDGSFDGLTKMKETKKGTGNDYGYRHEMKMEKGFFFGNLDNVNLK